MRFGGELLRALLFAMIWCCGAPWITAVSAQDASLGLSLVGDASAPLGQVAPGRAPNSQPSAAPQGRTEVRSSAAPTPPSPEGRTAAPAPQDLGLLGSLFGNRAGAATFDRLAAAPNVFGDFYLTGGRLVANDGLIATTDLPLAGGCGRLSVADNNQALTRDRAYVLYNHFQNAIDCDASQFIVGPDHRRFAVDRYTIGAEKSLANGLWSVEVRMPFCGQTDFYTPNFSVGGGDVGNLAVIVKRVLYQSESTSVAAGFGIDTPTGSDVTGHVNLTRYTVHNDAVHIVPYVGILRTPDDRIFYHGFLQVDVPTNGNRVDYDDLFFGTGTFGTLNEQTLLRVNLSAGYWLYQNRSAAFLTGLAPVVELHCTTALNSPGPAAGDLFVTSFQFSSPRTDTVTDLTVGLHGELLGQTLCRVGAVFPLGQGIDRTFDAEVMVQLERRF